MHKQLLAVAGADLEAEIDGCCCRCPSRAERKRGLAWILFMREQTLKLSSWLLTPPPLLRFASLCSAAVLNLNLANYKARLFG